MCGAPVFTYSCVRFSLISALRTPATCVTLAVHGLVRVGAKGDRRSKADAAQEAAPPPRPAAQRALVGRSLPRSRGETPGEPELDVGNQAQASATART